MLPPTERQITSRCPGGAPRGCGTNAGVRSMYGASRVSAARAIIAKAVLDSPGAFTAEELRSASPVKAAGVGLATVYRALSAMQDAGTVAPVGERGGSVLLAHCSRDDHHHHFVCTACDRVTGVDCPFGDGARGAAERDGRLVTRHEITLYGLCDACRASGGDA